MERKSNTFTHKFLPLFGLFCFIFFCFLSSEVSAFSFTGSNGVDYNLPDLPANGSFFSSDWYCFYLLDANTMGMTSLIGFDPSIQCYFSTGDRIGYADYNGTVVNSNGVRRGFWRCSINGATRWDYNNPQSQSNPLVYQGFLNIDRIIYSTFDVYSASNLSTTDGVTTVSLDGIGFQASNKINILPYIVNSEAEIRDNSFDFLYISAGDYDITETDSLDFIITNEYIYNLGELEGFVDISKYQQYLVLNSSSPYYKYNSETGKSMFVIPKEDLTVFRNIDNESYRFQIYAPDLSLAYDKTFTINLISGNEEMQNLISEGNETNKSIFSKIGDIFNILNPLSDKFFGKTLVNLIVDGLKGLFIPEDGYFDSYFQELQDWFSDRLGFLYYPLDLLFSLCERFLQLGDGSLTINIPEINEPFTGLPLIEAQTLDFNELLANETLRGMHNIYLLVMDASIYIGLVLLLYHKYEKVVAS